MGAGDRPRSASTLFTAGIISAIGAAPTEERENYVRSWDRRRDQPGNSGGPLFNPTAK
jgi:S1-C subfamily serine protease